MNLQALLSTATVAATEAETIIPAVDYFVKEAEAAAPAGATGATKLVAVKAALQAFLTANFPHLVAQFDTLWTSLQGVINGLVSLYNSLGVFKKAAPAPA